MFNPKIKQKYQLIWNEKAMGSIAKFDLVGVLCQPSQRPILETTRFLLASSCAGYVPTQSPFHGRRKLYTVLLR